MRKMEAALFRRLSENGRKARYRRSRRNIIEIHNSQRVRGSVTYGVAPEKFIFMDSHHSLVGVVDDDPRVLESFEELLAAGGYEALLFGSAEAFLDANGFEQVDCLISDIGMPAMSGWDLLRIVRTELPSLPVILITARDEDLSREALDNRGARCLFRKPFDGKALLATLDKILRR